jgi:hypothetical protein
MTKQSFSSHLISDEITICGYKTLTFAVCTTDIIVVFTVTYSLGSSQD